MLEEDKLLVVELMELEEELDEGCTTRIFCRLRRGRVFSQDFLEEGVVVVEVDEEQKVVEEDLLVLPCVGVRDAGGGIFCLQQ